MTGTVQMRHLSGANVKKGLELDGIKKIVDYSPEHESHRWPVIQGRPDFY